MGLYAMDISKKVIPMTKISRDEFVKLFLKHSELKATTLYSFGKWGLQNGEEISSAIYNSLEKMNLVLLDAGKWKKIKEKQQILEEEIEDYRNAYKDLKKNYLDLQRRTGLE